MLDQLSPLVIAGLPLPLSGGCVAVVFSVRLIMQLPLVFSSLEPGKSDQQGLLGHHSG